jgi:hypothetical protein
MPISERCELDQKRAPQTDPAATAPTVSLELAGQDGQKAVCLSAIIRTRAVDLVTLDFSLPGVDGATLDLKDRRGQLLLTLGEGEAPLKLPGQVTSFTSIFNGQRQYRLGFKLTALSAHSSKVLEKLTPYPFGDMKSLWEQYDKNQEGRLTRMPNKDFYILAGGLILGGAVVSYSGLAFSRLMGSFLMIGGSLCGIYVAMRSLLYQRRASRLP